LRKTCSNKHSLTSMRIITYSDLHLEFSSGWMLPPAVKGDVMILAGDLVTLTESLTGMASWIGHWLSAAQAATLLVPTCLGQLRMAFSNMLE
jgi:hypothetical protein